MRMKTEFRGDIPKREPTPTADASLIPRFDLHAIRYGEYISNDLKQMSAYTEKQCSACVYDHKCCNMIVQVTPAEVAGILQWLETKLGGNVMGLVASIRLRSTMLREHFKKFEPKHQALAVSSWFAKGIKCVFYDKDQKKCGIYQVRPLRCRMTFGAGDCSNGDAIRTIAEADRVTQVRVERYMIHPQPKRNLMELTTAIEVMCQTGSNAYIALDYFREDPKNIDPKLMLFGIDGDEAPRLTTKEISYGHS